MKNVTFCLMVFLLLSCQVCSAGNWPVFDFPQFTDPTPSPGNTGTGVLNVESIVPNIKIINPLQPNETWTIECVDAPDYKFKLRSDLVGDDGFFFASEKFRSNSGKMVLVPYPFGSVDAKIVAGNPDIGDSFEFTLSDVDPSEHGNLMNLFGDHAPAQTGYGWHGAVDIRVPGSVRQECHIYPVRDGVVRKVHRDYLAGELTKDSYISVEVSPGIYDTYLHIDDIYVEEGDQIVASGKFSTCISGGVVFDGATSDKTRLHYDVYDWYEVNPPTQTPSPKPIRNPLNGILPINDSTSPETAEFLIKSDDFTTPTPGVLLYAKDKVDVIAVVRDDNGGPPGEFCGIHQLQYQINNGFGINGTVLQSGILFNDDTFRGEHPGQPNEYSPDWFSIYPGCHNVPGEWIFSSGTYFSNQYYIVTNNNNPSGEKPGLLREGCWDTRESVSCPLGSAFIFPDGPYTTLIQSADIAGNWSDDENANNSRTFTVMNDAERVVYVESGATGGSGALEAPYGTITEAVSSAGAGVRTLVYVKPGFYHSGESFPIRIKSGLTIQGADQRTTIVHGYGNSAIFTFIGTGAFSGVRGLTIQNAGNYESAIKINNFSSANIFGNRIRNNSSGAIYIGWSNMVDINNNIIENSGSPAIHLYHCNQTIRDTLTIRNCTITNNGQTAILAEVSSWFNLVNSIICNSYYAVLLANNGHVAITRNNLYNCQFAYVALDYLSSGSYDGYMAANPVFEAVSYGDYYLRSDGTPLSPCIDAGQDNYQSNPQIYLKTTRVDNEQYQPSELYDDDAIDLGFHYDPIYTPTPAGTPTPTNTPTRTPTQTQTPSATATYHPGTGYVSFDLPQYFTTGATAEIMVVDPDLNTNPMTTQTHDVIVKSQTDTTGIFMTVTELDPNSSVFTTSVTKANLAFSTSSSIPYTRIQVSDGDWVTVEYDDISPTGTRTDTSSWHSSSPPPTNTPRPTSTPTATATATGIPTVTPTALTGEFFEDFEGSTDGWTLSGLWHLTTDDYFSPNTSLWYGQEATGNYDTGSPNSGSAVSPRIQLDSDYYMTFHSREETEGPGASYDTRRVYVTTDDGETWTRLYQSTNNDDAWHSATAFSLHPYTGESVRIKFEFDTVDDMSNNYRGWLIDDVEIGDVPPPIPSTNIYGLVILLLILGYMLMLSVLKLK